MRVAEPNGNSCWSADYPTGVELESTTCPLGCLSANEFVLTGHDLLHNIPGEFTVVRCRACDLMRTDPRPSPEGMTAYYPNDYGPYLGTQIVLEHKGLSKTPLWKAVAKRLIQFNVTRLPEIPPGRMLEIGCASGSYLHVMAQRGWDVAGIEYSASAADNARTLGYAVHAGSVETAPDPAVPYDLVVGWMVLEHLHEPLEVLRRIRTWTKLMVIS